MFRMRKPLQTPPVYFSKPNGPVYSLPETIEVILLALHVNRLGFRPDQRTLTKIEILKERIPLLLPSMDEMAIAAMMSVLTGCGKQVKVRGRYVDRGIFEFDSWVGAFDQRSNNLDECHSITDDWLSEFINHGQPLNVLMI